MKGFTLLEILISLFILSILLLGIDAMQLTALREAKTAYYVSVATQQLNNMLERLQVTKQNSMAELERWNEQNYRVLPNGHGMVEGIYPHVRLAVYWGGINARDCVKDKIEQSGCLHIAL